MSQTTEPVEAVIISGSRRGEIIQLPQENLPGIGETDLHRINDALDELLSAVDRLAREVRATNDALQHIPEAA